MFKKYTDALDKLATELQEKGNMHLAYQLDEISDALTAKAKNADLQDTLELGDPSESYMVDDFGPDETVEQGDPDEDYMTDFGDDENVVDVAYNPVVESSDKSQVIANELLKLAKKLTSGK